MKSAGLYAEDHVTGKNGFNLAAVMLLGRDEVIRDICPAYQTDALVRKVNVDRYDDRLTVVTNLVESLNSRRCTCPINSMWKGPNANLFGILWLVKCW